MSRRAVFLDRDGVLNEVVLREGRPHPPAGLEQMRVISGARHCLEQLKSLGFLLIVVTNQPDVARGRQTRAAVEEMNRLLAEQLPIDDTYVCYHDEADACDCRKPAPGMILEAARRHGIELAGSFLIGDRWRDVEAGRRAHCKTVWIDCGYAEPAPASPDFVAHSLAGATDWIISHTRAADLES